MSKIYLIYFLTEYSTEFDYSSSLDIYKAYGAWIEAIEAIITPSPELKKFLSTEIGINLEQVVYPLSVDSFIIDTENNSRCQIWTSAHGETTIEVHVKEMDVVEF